MQEIIRVSDVIVIEVCDDVVGIKVNGIYWWECRLTMDSDFIMDSLRPALYGAMRAKGDTLLGDHSLWAKISRKIRLTKGEEL